MFKKNGAALLFCNASPKPRLYMGMLFCVFSTVREYRTVEFCVRLTVTHRQPAKRGCVGL